MRNLLIPAGIILALICMVCIIPALQAQELKLRWANQSPGSTSGDIEGKSLDTDAFSNLYASNNIGNQQNGQCFLTKFDSCGGIRWRFQLRAEGKGGAKGSSMVVSPDGHCFLSGFFWGKVDFDPGPGETFREAGHFLPAAFVARYDPQGRLTWINSYGDKDSPEYQDTLTGAQFYSIARSGSGDIFITGNFTGKVDFDAGPGTRTAQSAGKNRTLQILLLQLGDDGVLQNIHHAEANGSGGGYAVALDPSGNVLISGEFRETTDFDPSPGQTTLQATGESDAFIAKYAPGGRLIWVKTMGSTFNELCNSLVVDATGNLYFKLIFALRQTASIDVDPGPEIFSLESGSSNRAIIKLDPQGNFLWAQQILAVSNGFFYPEYNRSLDMGRDGTLYYTGSFQDSLLFDPGNLSTLVKTRGKQDIFILAIQPTGDFKEAYNFGGVNSDGCTSIAVDEKGQVYTTGYFNGVADFDPGQGYFPLNSSNSNYNFVQKLSFDAKTAFVEVTSCRSYVFNGVRYDSSGVYLQRLPSATGCDSLVSLQLTIGTPKSEKDTLLCAGSRIFAGGQWRNTAGVYRDSLKTPDGCDSIHILKITYRQSNAPNLGLDRNLCKNQPIVLDPGSFDTYKWQDQTTGRSFQANSPGLYWVSTIDQNGCEARDSILVKSIVEPPSRFLPPRSEICAGEALQLNVPGFRSYAWNTGSTSQTITVREPGTYQLSVTDRNGCLGKDSIQISLDDNCIPISIPNAFTPNGDGLNDLFMPLLRQETAVYRFRIFDRWGKIIFESSIPGKGWDGNAKGMQLPPGVFTWDLNMKNIQGKPFFRKGTVMLVR